MVIVDANVLIYAVDTAGVHHARTREWLDSMLAGAESVGLAWVVLLGFIRLTTNASVFPHPLSPDQALDQVERWLGAPAALTVMPTPRHPSILRGLLAGVGTAGNLTTDAHLAALAVEHAAEIVSYDRDFGRFPGVRHRLPG